jgi:hypothetical protein
LPETPNPKTQTFARFRVGPRRTITCHQVISILISILIVINGIVFVAAAAVAAAAAVVVAAVAVVVLLFFIVVIVFIIKINIIIIVITGFVAIQLCVQQAMQTVTYGAPSKLQV